MTNPNVVTVQSAHGPSTPALTDMQSIQVVYDTGPAAYRTVEVDTLENWYDNSGGASVCPGDSDINSFARRSGLIGRLTWTARVGRQLYFDLGAGLRLCVWATTVEFSVLGPKGANGMTPVNPGDRLIRSSRVSVSRIQAQVSAALGGGPGCDPCFPSVPVGSLGFRQGRLTITQYVTAGAVPGTLTIPPGVTDVEIYESNGATPANIPWVFESGIGGTIGEVSLTGGRSGRVSVPGPAFTLRANGNPIRATSFTLSYGMDW